MKLLWRSFCICTVLEPRAKLERQSRGRSRGRVKCPNSRIEARREDENWSAEFWGRGWFHICNRGLQWHMTRGACYKFLGGNKAKLLRLQTTEMVKKLCFELRETNICWQMRSSWNLTRLIPCVPVSIAFSAALGLTAAAIPIDATAAPISPPLGCDTTSSVMSSFSSCDLVGSFSGAEIHYYSHNCPSNCVSLEHLLT